MFHSLDADDSNEIDFAEFNHFYRAVHTEILQDHGNQDQPRSRRKGAALSPEMGVFAPPSPFFKNVSCVRETDILVEQ